jgi:hypothetical protein
MNEHAKRVEALTVEDIAGASVWQFTNNNERIGETAVRPIKTTPVKNLNGRLVATQVRLANGSNVWALIGNVDPTNPKLTQHFLTLSVEQNAKWFTMARYHDFDAGERGPQALATFMRLPVDDVFPISYDISRVCEGDPAALVGTIEKEPQEKLTRAQIIGLAVP